MVNFGQYIALSLSIRVTSGDQNVQLDSENTKFGILEIKVDNQWVTGRLNNYNINYIDYRLDGPNWTY